MVTVIATYCMPEIVVVVVEVEVVEVVEVVVEVEVDATVDEVVTEDVVVVVDRGAMGLCVLSVEVKAAIFITRFDRLPESYLIHTTPLNPLPSVLCGVGQRTTKE